MLFQFETTATMKPYNTKKWWIDSGIIRKITIKADNIAAALERYGDAVKNNYYIDISKSALNNKKPMYYDNANGETQQCGYVITASTDFDNDRRGWVKQYIDLWVNISVIVNPFEEV